MNTNLCPTNMFLYVHTINSYRRSNLRICSPLINKNKKRVIIDEVFNLKMQISINITNSLFYSFENFHEHPHGLHPKCKRHEIQNHLIKNFVEVFHVDDEIDVYKMYPLQIYHKNSDICKGIYNLSIDIKTIMLFVIENGLTCDNRDSFGHSYRLRINFNQPQSTNSTSSRYYDEKRSSAYHISPISI